MTTAQAPQSASAAGSDITHIAVGDIHGCNDLLIRLLEKIDQRMGIAPYRLVFLGDYVDRGPDSRGVLDTLAKLKLERPDTIFLKGNHEQAMLDFLGSPHDSEAWLSWGGEETLGSYGIPVQLPINVMGLQDALANTMPDRHFQFLLDLDLIYATDRHVFVHAGLNPDRALDAQQESDLLWIRDPFFQSGKGRFPGKTIVHGHTPVKSPMDLDWRINVDTGAVWSAKLTAVVLRDGKRTFITT